MDELDKTLLSLLSSLSFRVTFYSRPNFFDSFLATKIEADSFKRRLMSEEERQRIDIDSASIELDNSIDEIVAQQIYIFYGVPMGGFKADLYVSPFFLFIDFDTDNNGVAIKPPLIDDVTDILNRLKSLSSDISTATFNIKGEFSVNGSIEDMQSFHKLPDNIDSKLLNFRNASEYKVDKYLLQIIQTGRTGINTYTEEPIMTVTTDGIASCRISDCDNFDFASAIYKSIDLLFPKIKELYNL